MTTATKAMSTKAMSLGWPRLRVALIPHKLSYASLIRCGVIGDPNFAVLGCHPAMPYGESAIASAQL